MADQNLIAFAFDERVVRTVVDSNNEAWFFGKDVAEVLGYADTVNALKQHCRGVVKRHPILDSLGRTQEARIISEPDLFRLIVNSKLPSAERFERWVFEEVLPSIRKTGFYGRGPSISQQLSAHGVRVRLLDKLEDERHPEKRLALHQQLEHVSRLLGLPCPALEAIGRAETPRAVPALVETFWEAVELIGLEKLNHARTPGLVAINLMHFHQEAEAARLKLPPLNEFRHALRLSDAPRFVEANRAVSSRLLERTVRCWVFDDNFQI